MTEKTDDEKILLPHHVQQPVCTTRLPYRQGRKLTAVKVYSIISESNHLLIFGIPSLNLRQEAKAFFQKFGKLKSFSVTTDYKTEQFSDTYHAVFEKIHSARMAKRMLDTKTFYGGSLHITYAPELEDLEETEVKLELRKYDVAARLRNLKKESVPVIEPAEVNEVNVELPSIPIPAPKLNMGEDNVIPYKGGAKKRKLKQKGEKQKPNVNSKKQIGCSEKPTKLVEYGPGNIVVENTNIEIVDCTSTDKETITNINEHLNIDKFDNIKIFKVPLKPVNKIKFNLNKKT